MAGKSSTTYAGRMTNKSSQFIEAVFKQKTPEKGKVKKNGK